jgi:hypothetical protein
MTNEADHDDDEHVALQRFLRPINPDPVRIIAENERALAALRRKLSHLRWEAPSSVTTVPEVRRPEKDD